MSLRQLVLDTETTGLEVSQDHRIIELACVELRHRRLTGETLHSYFNPQRAIDAGAQEVHGIDARFLADKPTFGSMAASLWRYLEGAELIIHNAAFDLEFLNAEFRRAGISQRVEDVCSVVDTLLVARKLHPGQKVNLDALCRRYGIDNSRRDLHGALIDAYLLADVYLAMTGGQETLSLDAEAGDAPQYGAQAVGDVDLDALPPPVILRAGESELKAHVERLAGIRKKSGKCLWGSDLPA